MPSTRAIAITALIASFAALFFSLTDFPRAGDSSATNPAAILLPAQTLAQTLNDPATYDLARAESYLFTGMQRGVETTYTHPKTGLTFEYPSDFELYVVKEDGGELIVGEKAEYGLAFQIFIQPWNEPGPLTVERIRRDLPDIKMEAVSETTTYKSDDPILTFLSWDKTLGYSPEAWFVHDGYLYQVAFYAPPEDDPNPLSVALFRGFVAQLKFVTP